MSVTDQIVPRPEMTLSVNGVDLMPHLVSWRIRRPWHGKATWDLTAWHTPDGQNWTEVQSDFCLPGYGDFANLLRHHNGSDARTLEYGVTVAGMTRPKLTLLPRSPACDGLVLTWPGEDRTAVLERDGATFPDILLDRGGVPITAHAAMKAMAATAGVKLDLRFKDFVIRVLRRARGRIIDWLDQLARVRQAGRRWEGNVLVYEAARKGRRASRHYKDNLRIEAFAVEETFDQVKNQFRTTRFEPVGSILGEQEARGSGAVGRVGNIAFDPASRTAYPEIRTNLTLEDWVFWDEADQFIPGNGGPILAAASPAARVEFTARPATMGSTVPPGTTGPQGNTGGAYEPFFEVVFTGGGRGAGLPYDNEFSFVKDDEDTQAIYGVVPDWSNNEDNIPATAQVGEESCQAVLDESVRHLYRGILATPYFDPFVSGGDYITVTDWLTRQVRVEWFVEAVNEVRNPGGIFGMELELSKGLSATGGL